MAVALGGGVKWDASSHCSEREPGHWTNCVPCSLNMLARANLEDIPSTNDWADAFRHSAGYPPEGPTSFEGFAKAFKARFGYVYRIDQPADPFLRIQPGYSAAIIGSNGAFKKGDPWRQHDPDFASFHCVFISQLPDRRVLRDDPLAPEGNYAGEFVSKDDVRAFYKAGGSARRIAYLKTGKDSGTIVTPPLPPIGGGPNEPVPPKPVLKYTQADMDKAVALAKADARKGARITDPTIIFE